LKALIDSDILIYRVGYTTMEVPEGIAMARMDEMIGNILSFLGTNDYNCYLTSTDHSNYRYDIYPEYKANRSTTKPTHYHLLRDYLINNHGAEVIYGQEADDALAQAQIRWYDKSKTYDNTCIVSIDKDLLQIPGTHFNFVKGLLSEVSALEALRCFYRQILTGDLPTDNIPGIRGLGPKTASKIIDHLNTERAMFEACMESYKKSFGESAKKLLDRNAQLLYIRTREGQGWVEPTGE
jgi:DNA polymerase I